MFRPRLRLITTTLSGLILFAANAWGQPTVSSVNNAADYSPVVSPGSLAVIFGSNLAAATASATSIPLPFALGGSTVTINGAPAPLLYVSPGQINLQIPYATAPGKANVTVTSSGFTSVIRQFQVASQSVGIFGSGAGRGIIQNADYSLNSAANPAASGSTVVVYLTGIGLPTVTVGDGMAASASALPYARGVFSASVGGVDAQLQFLGLTPGLVGLAQANITLPNLGSADYPLIITLAGQQSASVTISVKGTASAGFEARSVLNYVGSVAVPSGTAPFLAPNENGISVGSVAVYGNYLYVCGTANVNVVDITNPSAPKVLYEFGDLDLRGGAGYLAIFKGGCSVTQSTSVPLLNVIVRGTSTFVASYSLANPAKPALVSMLSELTSLSAVSFSGNTAYLLETHGTYDPDTYRVITTVGYLGSADYSNPARPSDIAGRQSGSSPAAGTSNFRLDMLLASPAVLYSAATTSTADTPTGAGALDVFDIGTPGSIVGRTRITVPGTAILVSLAAFGNQMIALGETKGFVSPGTPLAPQVADFPFTGNLTLTFFDITNPANPVMGPNYSFPGLSPDGCRAFPLSAGFYALSCGDSDLSATGEGPNGSLYVLDVRNPAKASASLYGAIQGLGGLAVANGYLYAATTAGANIYCILTP